MCKIMHGVYTVPPEQQGAIWKHWWWWEACCAMHITVDSQASAPRITGGGDEVVQDMLCIVYACIMSDTMYASHTIFPEYAGSKFCILCCIHVCVFHVHPPTLVSQRCCRGKQDGNQPCLPLQYRMQPDKQSTKGAPAVGLEPRFCKRRHLDSV